MRTRIASIESFRVLASLGVILWHLDYFWHTDLLGRVQQLGGGGVLADVTADLVWWVCLPYFFLVAGYFFRKSVQAHVDPFVHFRRYASSLVWIFLFWLCVYIIVPSNWPSEVRHRGFWQPFYSEMLKNLTLLTTQGLRISLTGKLPVWHLWFIPALLVGLAALTGLEKFRLQRYVIPSIIGLYALALGDEVYAGPQTLQGLWFLSILLAALGWWLAEREQPNVLTAVSLMIGGAVIGLMEEVALKQFFHWPSLAIHDHWYLGGIVLALGIFMLALAKPDLGRSTPLPYLAQFTLGVYVSHILVIYTLIPIGIGLHNLWPGLQWLLLFVVYFLAVLVMLVLSKVPIARHLITRTPRGTFKETQVYELVNKGSSP